MKTYVLLVMMTFSCLLYAKRLAPAPVKPITNAGLRFEVLQWASDNSKMKQNGGFIQVVNTRNNLPICTKQVYETKYDKDLEQDVQDNFITGLKIENAHLVVNSEKLASIKKPLANFCD